MAILSDKWIRNKAQTEGMIEPFVEAQRREGMISFGLSSYGYDARVADEFKVFTNVDNAIVDREFFAIVDKLGFRAEVAKTLDDFLLASPSQYAADEPAVRYVIGKLWVDPLEGSK